MANSLGAQTFTRVSPSTISVFTLCSNIESDSHVKQGHRNKKQVHNNKKATDTKDASYKGHKQHKSQTPLSHSPKQKRGCKQGCESKSSGPQEASKCPIWPAKAPTPQAHGEAGQSATSCDNKTNPSDLSANAPMLSSRTGLGCRWESPKLSQ